MTASQPVPPDLARPVLETDLSEELRDFLSSLNFDLGLGWGLFLGLVVPSVVVAAAGAALVVWLWRRTSGVPSRSTGADLFRGQVVTVNHAEGSHGQAFVEGSWWSVRSGGAALHAGEQVRVREVDRLVLVVEQLSSDTAKEEEDTS